MFAARGEFGTSVAPPAAYAEADLTAYAVSAFARKLVSSNFVVELGGLWADRGPALDHPDFHFRQPQRWVYLTLTATTRVLGRWAQ
jgi:hypothetical protein